MAVGVVVPLREVLSDLSHPLLEFVKHVSPERVINLATKGFFETWIERWKRRE